MNIFGWEIVKKVPDKHIESVITPENEDGSSTLTSVGGGHYGAVLDLDGRTKTENEMIRRYRETATYPEVDSAIDDICNEALVFDESGLPVDIVLDDLKVSDGIKKRIIEEYENIMSLLNFEDDGLDIFRMWYIDGRLYYHPLLDPDDISDGIQEIRYIDPRKIKKVRKVIKERNDKGVEVVKKIDEFFMYNDRGIDDKSQNGIRMSKDSIIHCPSGLIDQNNNTTISYIHKAVKPVNQLKMVENALVIYRLARAPERRVFYVDTGTLPKVKAEQYVNDIMNKFRNKIVYDASTGEVKDDRRHMAMLEDFWMPRREGSKGTEITTLPGGQNLGEIADIEYFQQKVYRALNVPYSRLEPQTGFGLGRSNEISRDEIKFSKFINRLRKKFAQMFLDLLRVQLVAKGIINADDWDHIKAHIGFDWKNDNHYAELKNSEIWNGRLATLQQIEPWLGRFFSDDWVKEHVLYFNDEEKNRIESDLKKEPPPAGPDDGG